MSAVGDSMRPRGLEEDHEEATVLTLRALNRATLARQLLLDCPGRPATSAIAVVEHLVGLQAQAPYAPYLGLWARVPGFTADALADPLREGDLVRIVLMRGTIHLVTAEDAVRLRPLVQPVLERELLSNTTYSPGLAGVDLSELTHVGRALLTGTALGPAELRRALADRFPGSDAAALAYAVRALVPAVQVPPRGVWGAGGQPRLRALESWVTVGHVAPADIDELVLRYLAAFGPATPRDAQTWSGLPRLGEVLERLRPRLVVLRGEDGHELFDLPDAPRPDPDTPVPVRLLAPYDNLVLSHADRRRVLDDTTRRRLMTTNGIINGPVLLDGFVAGTWKLELTRRTATATLLPYRAWRATERDLVEAEARRTIALAAAGADREVSVTVMADPTD